MNSMFKKSLWLTFILSVVFMFIGVESFGQKKYSGSKHTTSHGGSYSSGRGSSHKGGHYKNNRTSNRYGRHKN